MFSKRKIYSSFAAVHTGTAAPYNTDETIIVCEKTPLDDFNTQEVLQADGTTTTRIVNDVAMLFNQQRLEKISPTTLQNFLNSLSSGSSKMLKGTYTDEQLLSFVKSRYIQAPSEIKLWSEYLNKVAESLNVDPPISQDPNFDPSDLPEKSVDPA